MLKWSEVQKVHSDSVSSVIATIGKIPAEKWSVPRAEGKWSAAEVAEHLIVAYDVMTGEVNGAPGMRIRTKWWQRALWRVTILPRLLNGTPFPPDIRAPRELRPTATRSQQDASDALRDRAAKFEAAVGAALDTRKKLTHAYLGKLSLIEGALFCARHLQHHEKQLAIRS